MQTLTEKIVHSPFKNRIFSDKQLSHMLSDSRQSRYGLVHRAMQAGEVQRIRRGLYTLNNALRDHPCHHFAIAQALSPLSYVSFETALAWHGWIPELVQITASVIPGRKKMYCEHPYFGTFTFHPLALEKNGFLAGVVRYQVDNQTFLVASPLRALFDLVCLRKMEWSGLSVLTEGLRIDTNSLHSLTSTYFSIFKPVYKHQRTRHFIDSLAEQIEAKHD